MTDLKNLNGKTIAVCFVYGNDGDLFVHCVGTGLFKDAALFVQRPGGEEPFCVSDYNPVLVKEIDEGKRAHFKGANHIVVLRVISRVEDFKDKKIALLLSDEERTQKVFVGACKYSEKTLYVDFGDDRKQFIVYRDWYPKIQAVTPEQKEAFGNAAFALTLSVGRLPSNADLKNFRETGLSFHSRE